MVEHLPSLGKPQPHVRIRCFTQGLQRTTLRALFARRNPKSNRSLKMNVQTKMQDIVGLTKATPLSRRGFMTASAASAAGFTLAAGPVRADAIKTDTAGLANPPVILVAQEIFGLHEYIKDVTRRLGKLGAFAVAADYYFRKGDLTKITEIPALLPIVNTKTDAELFADLDAAVAWAKSQGGNTGRLGIM